MAIEKKCVKCGIDYSISDKILEFLDSKEIPYPTLCTDCREQRRISFRNEKHFYRSKCRLCGKSIITIYSPDTLYRPLCSDCWWGDKWDASEIGKDFDFSRSFFEQFDELIRKASLLYLFGTRNVNSEFVNQETDDKNCYFNAGGHYNEDCFYNTYAIWCKDTVDGYWNIKSERCYESIHLERCFDCNFCQDSEGCTECDFCKECISCSNCFGCFGLRHKNYYIFNEEASKEEYERFLHEERMTYFKNPDKHPEIYEHYKKYPHSFAHQKRCENCTGDYLWNCKNSYNSFLLENAWDCENFYIGLEAKNCFDVSSFGWGELLYEVASSIELYDCHFCTSTVNVKFSQYCYVCQNSKYLFGCAGVKGKEYCIFNKQYSKEEYENLKFKIVDHMKKTGEYGEFFPMELSPFEYENSVANDYFPLKG